MGYDLNRFNSEVDNEFICSICTMVLENGVHVQGCDHIFCDKCIREWLHINKTCPMDRKELSKDNIKPICRSFQNLLLKLMIKCDFEVDDEFICSICTMVLENGVQMQGCEHVFCDKCIREWLQINKNCPIDRNGLSYNNIKSICRPFQNLLLKLMIKCEFETYGCQTVIKLDSLQIHINICLYNPKLKVKCNRECGLEMSQKEYELHNCTSSLASLVISLQKQLLEHKSELKEIRKHLWISPNGLMVNNNIIECYRECPTDEYIEFTGYQFAQNNYPLTEQNSHFNIELLQIREFSEKYFGPMFIGNNYLFIGLSFCYLNKNQDMLKYKGIWFSINGKAYLGNEKFSALKPKQKWFKGDIITCGVIFNEKDDKSSDDVLVYFKRNNELFYEQKLNINDIGLFPTIKIDKPGMKIMIT